MNMILTVAPVRHVVNLFPTLGCENAVLFTSVFGYGPRAYRHSVLRTKTSVNKTHFPSPGREYIFSLTLAFPLKF